jgi:hypothetical protein
MDQTCRLSRSATIWVSPVMTAALIASFMPACRFQQDFKPPAPVDGGQARWDAPAADASSDGPPCFVSTSSVSNLPICCGRPGQVLYFNCMPWSLVEPNLQHCVEEGRSFDGHLVGFGLACCPGLSLLMALDESDAGIDNGLPEGCNYPPGPPGLVMCQRCGDGTCSHGENRCSCPADCPAP